MTKQQTVLYFSYVDDTLATLNKKSCCDSFLTAMNCLLSCLTFTFENEIDGKFLFPHILVEKADKKFLASLDQTSTFRGQHKRWDSLGLQNRKRTLLEP